MLERVGDPGTYQAFQHFITDAPWSADVVWRQLRATIPDREGVLILDGTSFPKQGASSVGVARQDLRRTGQDCQLPNRGDGGAVDRRTRVDAGRDALSARRVAHDGAAPPRPDPRSRAGTTEMAAGAHARATGARLRIRVTAVLGDAEFGESATLRRRCIDCSFRMRSASRPR